MIKLIPKEDDGVKSAGKNHKKHEDKLLHLLWYRNNEEFVKTSGMRKAFHKGGNSLNRFHIRQHYEIYKERCEKDKIPLNHWAIPPNIVKAKKAAEVAAQGVTAQGQQQLTFKPIIGPVSSQGPGRFTL